jgi:hypothetical protein
MEVIFGTGRQLKLEIRLERRSAGERGEGRGG